MERRNIYCTSGDLIVINGKHVVVVPPAYNAEKTLRATMSELSDIVDYRTLVDDV